MWDFDKLFTEGNIVGIKVLSSNRFYNYIVDNRNINNNSFWSYYKNNTLTDKDDSDFEIQYIIRLDEHGNVVEKLFDRDKDMPKPMPELETGMFVLMFNYDHTKTRLGYINAERNMVIYQIGGWDYIDENKDEILKIYSDSCNCFDACIEQRVIWRSPEYQDYLDSKSN